MIDEHAGELLADRLVDQHGGDRRIDAAREAADHAALADLRADFLDRLVLEGAHGPVALRADDLAHEVAQDQRRAVRRVHHFGVKHQPVVFARLVLDDGERRVRRNAGHLEARRHLGDAVAVAHPDGIAFAVAPDILEQVARRLHHLDVGAAEFAVMAALDRAAELRRHRHLAVADAEHRHAGVEDRLRRARRAGLVNRRGAAGEDDAARLHRGEGGGGFVEGDDLAVDPLLAHAPGDELGDLRAEIDDENLVVRHCKQVADRRGSRNGASSPPHRERSDHESDPGEGTDYR